MSAIARLLPLLTATVLAACGGRESGEPRPRGDAAAPAAVTSADRATPPRSVDPADAAKPAGAAIPQAASDGLTSGAEPPVPTPATADPTDAAAILRSAAAAWKDVRTLRADFTQRLTVPLMGTEQTSRGRIFHRRPDHFLMRFSDPAGDVLVADGRHAWMYYPSVDRTQVLRSSLTGSGGELDLQREFLDNPTARYVPTVLGEGSVGGRPAWALSLVPKDTSPYKLVKVWVDQRDALVRRFEMTEENGSVRRLELNDVQTGVSLPDSLFAFTPPPGTQVFDQ